MSWYLKAALGTSVLMACGVIVLGSAPGETAPASRHADIRAGRAKDRLRYLARLAESQHSVARPRPGSSPERRSGPYRCRHLPSRLRVR
jgi:hypothetical protein